MYLLADIPPDELDGVIKSAFVLVKAWNWSTCCGIQLHGVDQVIGDTNSSP